VARLPGVCATVINNAKRNTYESFGPIVRDRLQRTFPIPFSEFPITPKGFPVLLKPFPVSLLREFPRKALKTRTFLPPNFAETANYRNIPSYFPC
jgi:hypothetical protein